MPSAQACDNDNDNEYGLPERRTPFPPELCQQEPPPAAPPTEDSRIPVNLSHSFAHLPTSSKKGELPYHPSVLDRKKYRKALSDPHQCELDHSLFIIVIRSRALAGGSLSLNRDPTRARATHSAHSAPDRLLQSSRQSVTQPFFSPTPPPFFEPPKSTLHSRFSPLLGL
jgi:hypothetical protein